MKYWGYLLVKLGAVALILLGVDRTIRFMLGKQVTILYTQHDPFTHDLTYTSVMMLFTLFAIGLLYVVIWDQRYRCRTCLRRLRMPMSAGSWPNMMLIGQPRVEYICIYGHGTLKVPKVELTGAKTPDWQPHDDDIWKELESIEAGDK
jgi:hypothetical protein